MAVAGQFNIVRGFITAADLSAHKHKAVLLASGEINVPAASAGEGADMIGILQDAPGDDKTGEVLMFGFTKVIAGEAIAIGDLLVAQGSDTAADAGKVMVGLPTGTAESDEVIIGRALSTAAADGNVIEAFINCAVPFSANRTA
jgi:hypothetical protein